MQKHRWCIAPTEYGVSIVTVESIAMWSWSYRGKSVGKERIVKHSSANLNNFIIDYKAKFSLKLKETS